MYRQFYISKSLPNIDNAINYQKCLVIGNWLMLLSIFIVAISISINFGFDNKFEISSQIVAHIATIIFAAVLKIGYVVRCIGLHGFGKKDF
jgi:hypothetical protein